MFCINHDRHMRGFQTRFANGWTVSIQFGGMAYGSNYMADLHGDGKVPYTSETAEIAAWNSAGQWHHFAEDNGTVKGYCTPDQVAAFIAMIVAKPTVIDGEYVEVTPVTAITHEGN